MLSTKQIACVKQDRLLFTGISVLFTPGTLYHVRGPNGVGKTSLLKILVGLSVPSEGQVFWHSSELEECREQAYADIIYVGHKLGLSQSLTALENLLFWCRHQSALLSNTQLMDKLMTMGLAGLEDIPVRYLSAGQQRRVALTRLLCKPSSVWVLDEPFTSLDTEGVLLVERKIASFVETGGCVIMTSHQSLSEAAGPCTMLDMEYPRD